MAQENIGMSRALISGRGQQASISRDTLSTGEIATRQYGD